MTGNAKSWKIGDVLKKNISGENGQYDLHAELLSKDIDGSMVLFSWNAEKTFSEILDDAGILPLPPYLKREAESEDEERYQTVYARADGSVAAPTAGLHFTRRVFDALKERDVSSVFLTLHVGAGTFKPVKSATMAEHAMHQEKMEISKSAVLQISTAAEGKRVIAVGTTSLRTLESLYWFGVKILSGKDVGSFFIDQWEPYALTKKEFGKTEALDAVVSWMEKNNQSYLNGFTRLLIAPGYKVQLADALVTNFHQPQSTLLLLVSALIGEDWRRVYNYALENDFRFLSFGDSSVLFTKRS
jgi:S-adenosylmethionine:tRNA ribosyltransferase-isomerase